MNNPSNNTSNNKTIPKSSILKSSSPVVKNHNPTKSEPLLKSSLKKITNNNTVNNTSSNTSNIHQNQQTNRSLSPLPDVNIGLIRRFNATPLSPIPNNIHGNINNSPSLSSSRSPIRSNNNQLQTNTSSNRTIVPVSNLHNNQLNLANSPKAKPIVKKNIYINSEVNPSNQMNPFQQLDRDR